MSSDHGYAQKQRATFQISDVCQDLESIKYKKVKFRQFLYL